MRIRTSVTAGAALLLLSVPAAAQAPAWAAVRGGMYVDADGSVRDADRDYEQSIDHQDAHVWRTFREMSIGLAALSVGYWLGMDRKVADFSYERFDESVWRADNNSLIVNFALHPLGGGLAYSWSRAYHHGVWGAAAYGFLSQAVWEGVLEFNRKGSVNDVAVTPTAGIPLGEFMHKLGVYLDSAQGPSTMTQVAQWSLGTATQVDRWLDDRETTAPGARDSLGFSTRMWHAFRLGGEVHELRGAAGSRKLLGRAEVAGRLVSIPGYLRPGHFDRTFWRADVTSAEVTFEGSEHWVGGSLAADTLLLGQHVQHIDGNASYRRGYAVTSGVSLAMSYLDSEAARVLEKYSAVHLPGPGLDFHAFLPITNLNVSARASFDYAGVGVLDASEIWDLRYPWERGKSILIHGGYLYAWGGSGRVSARLQVGPLLLRGSLLAGRYRSIEGWDKWPEKITVDAPGGTELLRYRASAGIKPHGSPITIGVSTEARRWRSWLARIHRRATVESMGLAVMAEF